MKVAKDMHTESQRNKSRWMRTSAAFSFLFLTFLLPEAASALPLFARQVGRNCTYCHTIIPKLNETGRIYKSNGYRFEAEKEWKDVKDMTVLPVSFEAEVEGAYDKTTTSGVKTETSDLKVEELEISGGAALDKTGRVSALVSIAVSQGE
ncbi:MAG: hypothetical protein HZB21_04530, partial [Deltaproteobacteria bacterium]|nr:hypothetical protein [Deltaproteobacteria bacterium]